MDFSDVRFEQGSFDLIFSRLLVLALSDWRAYIERCVAFAKPDGWIEMQDFFNEAHHVPIDISYVAHLRPRSTSVSEIAIPSHSTDAYQEPSPWLWESTLGKLLVSKGVDLYCGSRIPSLFAEAGLTEIRIKWYIAPYSRRDGLTEAEKAFANYPKPFARDVLPVAIPKAGEHAGPEYARKVKEAIKDMRQYYEAFNGGRK